MNVHGFLDTALWGAVGYLTGYALAKLNKWAMTPAQGTCCDDMYWCPTANDWECAKHGGFDVCCNKPQLHKRIKDQ